MLSSASAWLDRRRVRGGAHRKPYHRAGARGEKRPSISRQRHAGIILAVRGRVLTPRVA